MDKAQMKMMKSVLFFELEDMHDVAWLMDGSWSQVDGFKSQGV